MISKLFLVLRIISIAPNSNSHTNPPYLTKSLGENWKLKDLNLKFFQAEHFQLESCFISNVFWLNTFGLLVGPKVLHLKFCKRNRAFFANIFLALSPNLILFCKISITMVESLEYQHWIVMLLKTQKWHKKSKQMPKM